MTTRSFLLAGTLALASLSVARTKSYTFDLSTPAEAGTLQLRAGEYSVKLDGSNAVFTDMATSQEFTTPAKIGHAGKKHEYTAVELLQQNGGEKITAIELGGSTETLEFNN